MRIFVCVIVLTCPEYVQHNACMLVSGQDMFASWVSGSLNLKLCQLGGTIQMKKIVLREVLKLLQLVNCYPRILFCIAYLGSLKIELLRLFSHFWWESPINKCAADRASEHGNGSKHQRTRWASELRWYYVSEWLQTWKWKDVTLWLYIRLLRKFF